MAQRLDYIKLAPLTILEAGCGTGGAIGELALRYPSARIVGLDVALPMLTAARERVRRSRSMLRKLLAPLMPNAGSAPPSFVCADIQALPLRGVVVDLVWSNLVLLWANDLPRALAEFRPVVLIGAKAGSAAGDSSCRQPLASLPPGMSTPAAPRTASS